MLSMNATTTESVEVRLLPFEGACLLGELEAFTAQAGDAVAREHLAAIVDRLDDGQAVASWLGEYVRLELKPDEVVELLEAVVAIMNSDTVRTQEVDLAISNIGEKLATFGYVRHSGRQA